MSEKAKNIFIIRRHPFSIFLQHYQNASIADVSFHKSKIILMTKPTPRNSILVGMPWKIGVFTSLPTDSDIISGYEITDLHS